MSDTPIPPPGSAGDGGSPIEAVDLREALEERYLSYALSTIMGRALPDVRDGLKPVHRRILYAMRQMQLRPDGPFKKSAKVVGEVMGNFHPHGDQAIYDAMVRLAQTFAVRFPLVDGQGNFGNIDGDNPAAMRYTESRLTSVADALLDGIDQDTIDFRETYDGAGKEPVVLPANFPNLLANGAAGIAVGMATNIPPHNVEELCRAVLHLIKHPNASVEKLVEFVPGPDFPTGGVIVEPREQIIEAYRTGRGGFRVRAKWEREELKRGGYQIVITEIPYQVQKARLVEKIAELLIAKKLPLLADVRDESAEDVRLVLEPKSRSVDPLVLMESLFKLTELEQRFGLNMNVLSRGQVPNVLGLRDCLLQWLDHRRNVLVRRSRFRLGKIEHRLEVLDGYLIAFLNIDEVIRIVRFEDEPKRKLIAAFDLSDVQAEAILNLRLRALSKLEEIEIRREHEALSAEKAELEALLASDDLQWARLTDEIKATQKAYAKSTELGRRRAAFAEAPEINIDLNAAMIEKEPITVILSEKGWIRALKGHQDDLAKLDFKQGDALKFAVHATTTDKLVVFATNGKFFTLAADKLPGGRGHGEPLRLMIDLEENHDFVELFVHVPGRRLLVASAGGYGFFTQEDDVVALTRKGKQVLNVGAGDEALLCAPGLGDQIAVVGENRKLLVFAAEEVGEMARGKGVRLQKYAQGSLSDARVFEAQAGLSWHDSAGRQHTLDADALSEWQGLRAQAGRAVPKGFPRSTRFGPHFPRAGGR
ncbi:MAG: DNA topoisomerase IV subunit A [Pseudomonadota bacterium]